MKTLRQSASLEYRRRLRSGTPNLRDFRQLGLCRFVPRASVLVLEPRTHCLPGKIKRVTGWRRLLLNVCGAARGRTLSG